MEIGVINNLYNEEHCFDHVSKFGLNVCQLASWDMTLARLDVAEYCGEKGLEFWFETGQEAPVVLLHTIERAGTGNLGKEVPVSEGMVRYPEFIARLKEIGFDGELIIEREIKGAKQIRDIQKTVEYLTGWL
jgi:L-ribulose-5-phosphate 3-epimerase